MFLPRVVRFPARGFIKRQVSLETLSGQCGPGNRPRLSCFFRMPENALPKFHPARTNRLHPGQKAAALLFDPETVDIRRVGTQIANARRGVFRVNNLTVAGAFRATMSHAQERARARFFKTHDLIAKPLTLWRIMR